MLRRFDGWSVSDVELAAHLRIRSATFTYPERIDNPAGWLKWLLAEADPAHPPATEHAAAVAAESVERREHTARVRSDGPTPRQRAWDRHAAEVAAERAERAAEGPGWLPAGDGGAAAERVAARDRARQRARIGPILDAVERRAAARLAGGAGAGESEAGTELSAAAAAAAAEKRQAEIRARAILRARRERTGRQERPPPIYGVSRSNQEDGGQKHG